MNQYNKKTHLLKTCFFQQHYVDIEKNPTLTMQCKKKITNRMMIRTLIATLRASNPLTTYMYSGNWLLEPLDSTVLSWVAINKS